MLTKSSLQAADHDRIQALFQHYLAAWNERNAIELASFFTEDASVVGFDGSQMNGRAEIGATIAQIFKDHQTATYIGIVREVRLLTPDTALLRAVAGMIPRGQHEINPAVNAVMSLTAVIQAGQWKIAHFQNTPAQFHGRPEASGQLTEELRRAALQ